MLSFSFSWPSLGPLSITGLAIRVCMLLNILFVLSTVLVVATSLMPLQEVLVPKRTSTAIRRANKIPSAQMSNGVVGREGLFLRE